MDNKNSGFKRGDRVEVIGISGYGTVLKDQGPKESSVEVKWDDAQFSSIPLAVNLRQVGWTQFPPKAISSNLNEAVKLIEEKRDELVKQRNSLNSQILNLEEAKKLILA